MASCTTAGGRPPEDALHHGRAPLLVRRESLADINSRDVGL
ncbi:hypothetical protein ACFXPY_38525 [Streptomyces sp. NPDC059153]